MGRAWGSVRGVGLFGDSAAANGPSSARNLEAGSTPATKCVDEFYCPGRSWVQDPSTKEVTTIQTPAADFCADGTSSGCKYDDFCQNNNVDCNCCNDNLEGRECRTRVMVWVNTNMTTDELAEAKDSLHLVTTRGARTLVTTRDKDKPTAERPRVDIRTHYHKPSSGGTVGTVYEVLFAMYPKDRADSNDVGALETAKKEVLSVFPSADPIVSLNLTEAGGRATVLMTGHEKPVVGDPAQGLVCHPCCYTRNLADSDGGLKTAHPNFDTDYEACLNLRDKFKDTKGKEEKVFDGTTTGLKSAAALDDACTANGIYPDMGVSAFRDGGVILYIIGIMYVSWRERERERERDPLGDSFIVPLVSLLF